MTALVTWPGVGLKILAAFELAFAALFMWLAATIVRELIDARRFNQRRGRRAPPFAALGEHPLLRRLAIDGRIHAIADVLAACRQLTPDDPRRRAARPRGREAGTRAGLGIRRDSTGAVAPDDKRRLAEPGRRGDE